MNMSPVHSEDKVTCWQLRDNQWNDEWPCLLVKVGRRSYCMNGSLSCEYSLISEVWVETDSPNYWSASSEWPWEAAQASTPARTHTRTPHTQTTYFHTARITVQLSLFSPLCPSWLPPIGAHRSATWAQYLRTQHTGTLDISINDL